MQLEHLYTNILVLDDTALIAHIRGYRSNRDIDLNSVKEPALRKSSAVQLTDEEKALMKKLGFKAKDLIALRAVSITTPEDEEDDDAEIEE